LNVPGHNLGYVHKYPNLEIREDVLVDQFEGWTSSAWTHLDLVFSYARDWTCFVLDWTWIIFLCSWLNVLSCSWLNVSSSWLNLHYFALLLVECVVMLLVGISSSLLNLYYFCFALGWASCYALGWSFLVLDWSCIFLLCSWLSASIFWLNLYYFCCALG